ncbi:MAG: methylmalonyl Co-A mutase-associated GTPase MeaB [Bdellovibrionales bacterium]|nr:methylmalonyl Co-A mutase-associated GTPase MeaB [Bdellovibrionales bacterium]
MSDDKIRKLIKKTQNKEIAGLSQLLTQLDRHGPKLLTHKSLSHPPHHSYRIGITGPPGAGKSTLINQLITEFRKNNLTVAVIAIDPSSPFSKGAILGDRIRYLQHYQDKGVFIRSLGSRGSLGGLCASAYLMLRALDNYGFDITIIETVGVGQSELDIVHVADEIAVVLVPESGDSIQAMKAGLLEISDLYIVNKSDRPGAEGFINELKASLELGLAYNPELKKSKILKTTATTGDGALELAEELTQRKQSLDLEKLHKTAPRLQAEARALLKLQLEQNILKQSEKIKSVEDLINLFKNS